jgi:hypothetical protein
MAVKVKLLDAPWEENFEAEDDMFSERRDGKLEIHRADGTSKVFRENSWETVEGKKKPIVGFA